VVREQNLDVFLKLLSRSDLSSQGVVNLLNVVANWTIRDTEMKSKILAVLTDIDKRYANDGYRWGLRLRFRRYSDQEHTAVRSLIQKIIAKNLSK
jgi:hypothetical protein